jgi:cAMP phosphodiesterases class-II
MMGGSQPLSAIDSNHLFEPVSSSAYFVRNDEDGNEILVFGDVEPDSLSMSPRNHIVWDDAAAKIVQGRLKAIFIECSFDESVRNEDLYGHLCPRHLVAELTFLAHSVMSIRKQEWEAGDAEMTLAEPPHGSKRKKKRKHGHGDHGHGEQADVNATPELAATDSLAAPPSPRPLSYVGARSTSSTRRKTSHPTIPMDAHRIATEYVADRPTSRPATPSRGRSVQFPIGTGTPSGSGMGNPNTLGAHSHIPHTHQITTNLPHSSHSAQAPPKPKEKLPEPLKGVTVHIIHVKDTMMDGPSPGTIILKQVEALGAESGLGVEWDVCSWGESIWV